MATDMSKLMHKRTTSYHSEIVNHNLTCELACISYYYIVAENTVMGYMSISHYQTIAADYSLTLCRRAAVDCHALSYYSIVSYDCNRILTAEFKILGYTAYNCSRHDLAIAAYA
jgi:hypothetical protein